MAAPKTTEIPDHAPADQDAGRLPHRCPSGLRADYLHQDDDGLTLAQVR